MLEDKPQQSINFQVSAIGARERILVMAVRQALIIALGALEDYLQIERSIVPRHRRAEA